MEQLLLSNKNLLSTSTHNISLDLYHDISEPGVYIRSILFDINTGSVLESDSMTIKINYNPSERIDEDRDTDRITGRFNIRKYFKYTVLTAFSYDSNEYKNIYTVGCSSLNNEPVYDIITTVISQFNDYNFTQQGIRFLFNYLTSFNNIHTSICRDDIDKSNSQVIRYIANGANWLYTHKILTEGQHMGSLDLVLKFNERSMNKKHSRVIINPNSQCDNCEEYGEIIDRISEGLESLKNEESIRDYLYIHDDMDMIDQLNVKILRTCIFNSSHMITVLLNYNTVENIDASYDYALIKSQGGKNVLVLCKASDRPTLRGGFY